MSYIKSIAEVFKLNENEELKKQLDKQGIVTYNYYINK